MAKEKKLNLKKIYKEINDIGKKLSHSKIYLVEGNDCELISTSLKELPETFHVTKAIINEEYQEYLYSLGITVDGASLGSVLGGTGVEIDQEKNSLSVHGYKTDSKTKTKILKEWETDYTFGGKQRYEMMKKINKVDNIYGFDTDYHENYYSKYEYDVEELINMNKFVLDVSDKLNIDLLKITNKMIKTLNKNTLSVTSYISEPLNLGDPTIAKRFHIIETKENIGTIISYYPFLDK